MSLITIVNSNRQLGRPKLNQMFLFWFEEYVIYLYGEFKLDRKTDSEIKIYILVKNSIQNLNNTVKGILLFCDNIPNRKQEEPTKILIW